MSYTSGGAGVQFGAFSSVESAKNQVARVKSVLGINAKIERNDAGLYRVRATGLSESDAVKIKNLAVENGLDCYIFH